MNIADVFVPAPKPDSSPSIWERPSPDPEYDAYQARRAEVFKKIRPKGNWKLPINAWIAEADFAECDNAAVFFTGGGLDIAARKGAKVRVVGAGYYNNIGA